MATLFRKRKRDKETTISKSDVSNLSIGDDQSQQLQLQSQPEIVPQESKVSCVTPTIYSFTELGLTETLVTTCRQLGLKRPTSVQKAIIPFLVQKTDRNILCVAPTGSGKTAAFALPILHHWQADPFGIYAIILTPTRELAQQIHQQVLALGNGYHVKSALVVGGLDRLRQSQALDSRPHFCVATPGRLAALLRGPQPPSVNHLRYLVLDEADRLLAPHSGFRDDTRTIFESASRNRQTTTGCQTLLFSATMAHSLSDTTYPGMDRFPFERFSIRGEGYLKQSGMKPSDEDQQHASFGEDTIPTIPPGLKQEYIFMPSRVRDAYLISAVKHLLVNGGQASQKGDESATQADLDEADGGSSRLARSAIIFVPTCERAALVSATLDELGVSNVSLHSYLSQNRRLASLAKFKSQQVLVLVATDVASRGLDIPTVDLVLQSQLPRQATTYVHRVGRTARAGRRGRAISLVGESDVALVHAAEKASGRSLEKCSDVTDDMAIKLLGSVTKAARLAKMKLQDLGFFELVQKFETRKRRGKEDRQRQKIALDRSASSS